ncbi:MAG: hypothetical protein Q4E53_03360 [Eubacteriales bacterium]|nr:hypothetical protein [Eubacteriales bacterium]
MSNILMIYGLLFLLGIGFLWHFLLHYSFEEGLMMSAISIVILLYLSGKLMKSFGIGMVLLNILGCLGVFLWILSVIFSCFRKQKKDRKKRNNRSVVISFPLICFIGLFLMAMVLFYNSFIIHVDELHMWAMLVKKMYKLNTFPAKADVESLMNCYATSLFHLFFQKIAGYSEQNMYVSSFAMMWIGLLLPFSGRRKKEWKKICLYIVFFYIAIYSLYMHGTKNLYVDLVTVTWAGGIAAWWISSEHRKRRDFLLLLAGCVIIIFAKPYVGILMVANLIFLIIWKAIFVDHKMHQTKSGIIKVAVVFIPIIIVGLLGVSLITLKLIHQQYGSLQMFFNNKEVHTIIGSFIHTVVGYSLSTKSELKITFVFAFFLVLFLWKLTADSGKKRDETSSYIVYTVLWSVGYLLVLLFAYMFIFPRAEALTSEGIRRYLSFPVIFNFVLILSQLLRRGVDEKTFEKNRNVVCFLILFFMLGLNKNYIAYNTSWSPDNIKKYDDITKVHNMVDELNDMMDEKDRVYFINQKNKDEYPGNMALFCLEDRISNFLEDPWYFYSGGSKIRIATKLEDTDINHLNDILKEGGYTYLWIYHSNNYLNKQFSRLSYCENVKDNHLYRIIYNAKGDVETFQSVNKK